MLVPSKAPVLCTQARNLTPADPLNGLWWCVLHFALYNVEMVHPHLHD